jgi:hypothetical protein
MMTGETEVIGEGLVPGPIWLPKTPHGLAWDCLPDKPCLLPTSAFDGKGKFITVLAKAPSLVPTVSRQIQSTPPYPISSVYVHVTEFFRLRVSLLSGPFAPGFPTKILH